MRWVCDSWDLDGSYIPKMPSSTLRDSFGEEVMMPRVRDAIAVMDG